jgi:translation initiation factor IF-3
MVMIIGPLKSKVDAKAEANAKRAANRSRPQNPTDSDEPVAQAAAADKTEEE